ncbi:uncharacterized protein LOC116348660 [Contarinia nasturtii]|uniref:uncharacterized protein LOC116348660 n=1 Tax=Contarinia nasturtii TaxID=265458 RepID=UPI0012D3D8C6|nr:uncharacterized protein LOC116348660 [Contarinia nasturtii]
MSYASNTKKFIHTISKVGEFDEQSTPEVLVQGIPWHVTFKKELHEGEEWFAVYLCCGNEDASHDWSHTALATVKLLPFEKNVEPNKGYISPYIFGNSHCIFGVNFIEWERLTNVENGFVRNDTIQMKIKIEVADPNDKDKSILKFDVLDKCCGVGNYTSFRLTVSNIDALMAVGTPEFMLRGLCWKMSIYNDASKWLRVLLEIFRYEDIDKVTCNVIAFVKLISTKNNVKSIEHVLKKKMTADDVLEECKFVSWDNLFDDETGFVRNNVIVLEVKIVAEQPDYAGQNEDVNLLKLECSICMEAIRDQELSSLQCSHMFCTKCIEDVIKARKKCPVCNAAAKLTDLRRCRLPFAS